MIVPYADNDLILERLASWLQAETIPSNFRIILIHDVWRNDKNSHEVLTILTRLPRDNFVYLKGKFGSPGSARNAGLDLFDADWVCFWDSDDIPVPNEFNRMILKAQETGAQLGIGSYEMFSSLRPKNPIHTGSPSRTNVAISPGFWRMAFSRNVLANKRFSSARMGEDQLFLMMIDYASLKTYRHSEVVYKYFTGSEMQLTAGTENYKELSQIMMSAHRFYNKKNTFLATYTYAIMINRLALTSFKHRAEITNVKKLIILFRLNADSPVNFLYGGVPSMFVIVIYELVDLLSIARNKIRGCNA